MHWPLDEVWYRAQVTRYVEKKDSHELVYLSDAVKEVLDLKKEGRRHVVKLVKTAYRGTLIRASAGGRGSSSTSTAARAAHHRRRGGRARVDEDGEDEWCWEHNDSARPRAST